MNIGRDGSPNRPELISRNGLGRDRSPNGPQLNDGALGESALPKSNGGFGETALPIFFNHLPRLTTRPEHIHQLRQTILNLAVRGKLVHQDPNDEPAMELLKRIRKERELLVREGKTKEGEKLGPASEREIPFEIPAIWQWVRVSEVADSRLGKMLDNAKNKGTPRRYLRNVNVRWFNFDLSDLLEMRFEDSELEEFSLRNGDVLICEGGEPGRYAVWDERGLGGRNCGSQEHCEGLTFLYS